MRRVQAVLALGMMALAGTAAEAQKGKPAPQPTIVNWRCDVQMRDLDGDAIRSDDGRMYVDGVDGLTCGMSPMESALAGNPAPGSATFYFNRGAQRAFFFPARAGAWAGGYDTGLQIRIFNLVTMPIGGIAETRAMAIPTSLVGAMYADNMGNGDAITDLVTVQRTDDCTWVVSFDAPGALVQRYKSLDRRTLLDTPQLPLGFTLTTRAPDGSTISECPL